MADPKGFLKIHRVPAPERDPAERVKDYGEIYQTLPEDELREQATRCMDCGVPFCNNACPLGNLIPDWNDLARTGRWREAIDQLHATNNFPEFTGLICPAPCESACVLAIDDDPVMIKQIEYWTIDNAFKEGWVTANPPAERTGRRVAVVGSGPAGLAAADELNQVGHGVTVFERDEDLGGLLRFGVPDAKLEKWIIKRRTDILAEEGIEFRCGVEVGVDLSVEQLLGDFDAVVLAMGSRVERDVDIAGRELEGVHFAMEYLYQRNRAVAQLEGREAPDPAPGDVITAKDRNVVVIGGGDTGMDCVSNAMREGAKQVKLLDVYPPVPEGGRYQNTPWPEQPRRLETTYALEEGGRREFGSEVIGLEGSDGHVTHALARKVTGDSSRTLVPVPDSEYAEPADLVLVAIGFTNPEHEGLVTDLGVGLDSRGNVKAGTFRTSVDGVYAAGDVRVGASLVVTAIAEGRRCARVVDRALAGREPAAA
ncbi:MAG TPA: glutamate synthase subunit beta [Solirubrobacterales bacterium]|nr:glutamate synthase subunit beta [Solirubrobacterales bacterium]